MKYIEVRRHTMRVKPSQDISDAGRLLAKKSINPHVDFDYALTSNLGRANASAELLGCSPTHKEPDLGYMPQTIFDKIGMGQGFSSLNQIMKNHLEVADFSRRQAVIYKNFIESIGDQSNALIISHGIIAELALISLFPSGDYNNWGEGFGYCEGFSFCVNEGRFSDLKILRVDAADYLLEN